MTSESKASIPSFDQLVGPPKGIKKYLYKIFPRYFWMPMPFELHALGVRIRSNSVRRRYKKRTNLYVNIGAGSQGKDGWQNVDLYPSKTINCVYDCRASLPFADNSVKIIFTEHFFEHIDYIDDVPSFLSECYRVLMPGGVIRIIVPDGEGFLRAYCADGWAALGEKREMATDHSDVRFGWRYNTKMEMINYVFRQGVQHRFAYDYPTLEYILKRAGFATVKQQQFGVSLIKDLALDMPERAIESVYAEAVK